MSCMEWNFELHEDFSSFYLKKESLIIHDESISPRFIYDASAALMLGKSHAFFSSIPESCLLRIDEGKSNMHDFKFWNTTRFQISSIRFWLEVRNHQPEASFF